jgi:hypothetical protein
MGASDIETKPRAHMFLPWLVSLASGQSEATFQRWAEGPPETRQPHRQWRDVARKTEQLLDRASDEPFIAHWCEWCFGTRRANRLSIRPDTKLWDGGHGAEGGQSRDFRTTPCDLPYSLAFR